jgi:hypothetical protein
VEKSSKIIILALGAALAIVSASLAAALATTVSNSQIDTKVISAASSESFLYVQHASSGTIEQENDASTAAIYKLTLNGIYNDTMSFSDRPDRKVDQITTARYVYLWTKGQDSFAADPPNAALVMNEAGGSEAIVVVELLNPVYDSEKQTLVYDIVALDPKEGLLAFRSSASLPDSFSQATLFIDNAMDGNCTPGPNADLAWCSLYNLDLSGRDLSYAKLTSANLANSNLAHSNLTGAALDGAYLVFTNLTGANLTSANLTGADLYGAALDGADLDGANLTDAEFEPEEESFSDGDAPA